MTRSPRRLGLALLSGVSIAAMAATTATAQMAPMPPEKSMSTLEYELLGRDDLWTYKSMDSYNEAPFLTELVSAGKLPPLEERLPAEPLVHLTGAMSDGVGEYGGVFRHVIGGRPEGFNWLAGQHQGWGGINMAIQECFVRVGPLWQVKAEDQSGPLPNLAKSWDWNDDRTALTLNLVEGIKWSDGDSFDTEDVAFWWEDNVQDDNVASRMSPNGMGEGTTLTIDGPYQFTFNFTEPQGPSRVQSLAYIQGCPGPSHVLKPLHPKHNSEATYDSYRNGQPADAVPVPALGPWVPVVHKPDEIVVMRRNPFYWKVDEAGNQLPYMNEMHFKLSTWSDRTTQAVAGTGDFSNMENPGNYVEALKQSQADDAPTKAQFGPRVLAWNIELNFSEDVGVEDDVDMALRGLFRDKNFRVALSHALNRDVIGQSIARGPFTYPFTGGFSVGSPYYDADSTVYYPYNKDGASAMLDELGLADTDGNGVRNLPDGGADIEIDMVYSTDEPTDKKQLDAVISQWAEVGIGVLPRPIDGPIETIVNGGTFNAALRRNHWLVPTRETCRFVAISDNCPGRHMVGDDGERNLFDWEAEIVDSVNKIQETWEPAEASAAAKTIQKNWTENVYTIGLVQAPAALLINKRIKNAHPGTPVFMFEWAEDGVVRERLWAAKDDQLGELLPGTVPEY